MRETKEKEIDGITFSVSQLPAMRGIKLMHKLTRAAGPALLKSLAGGTEDLAGLGSAAQDALDRFSADELEALIKELFETATLTIDGKTSPIMPVFNDVLAGKTGTVLKAVWFALGVNYGDFLGGALASIGQLASQAGSPLKGISPRVGQPTG